MSKLNEYLLKADYQRNIIGYLSILNGLTIDKQMDSWSMDDLKEISELLKPAAEYFTKTQKPTGKGMKKQIKRNDDYYTQF